MRRETLQDFGTSYDTLVRTILYPFIHLIKTMSHASLALLVFSVLMVVVSEAKTQGIRQGSQQKQDSLNSPQAQLRHENGSRQDMPAILLSVA